MHLTFQIAKTAQGVALSLIRLLTMPRKNPDPDKFLCMRSALTLDPVKYAKLCNKVRSSIELSNIMP